MKLIQVNETPWTYEEAKENRAYAGPSFETQLFKWTDWDQLDTACFSFYDCTLVIDIGTLKSGEFFDTISVDYEKSLISLWKDDWKYDEDNEGFKCKEILIKMEF